MKDKRKIAWALVVTLMANQVTPAFASNVYSASNADMAVEVQSADEAVETDSNARIATSSNVATYSVAYVDIPDEGLFTALYDAYDTDTDGLMSVEEMESVTKLWAGGYGISDLTGLEYATNLECLDLSSNELSDIEILSELPELISVNLNNNYITDLTPLTECENLVYLEVNKNKLTEIPSFKSLEKLALYHYETDDDGKEIKTPLEMFVGNKIPAEGFADKFAEEPSEEWLEVNAYNDTLVEIPDACLVQALIDSEYDRDNDGEFTVTEMSVINWLDASYYGIEDLTGLEYATNIIDLNLSYNQISDISLLAGMSKLRYLYLNNNEICDLSPVQSLTKLYDLEVRNNQLTELPTLTDLTYLDLYNVVDWDEEGNEIFEPKNLFSGNRIPKTGFANKFAADLTEEWLVLNSYDATIVEIEDENLLNALIEAGYDSDGDSLMCVSEMYQVDWLDACCRNIKSLSGIEYAVNLNDLWIDDNKITDLTPLVSLKNLGVLYARNNKLTEVPDLSSLKNLILYDYEWVDDETEKEVPRNIFGGNQILADEFVGKFARTLTDEWLELNSYDATKVDIPDENLLNALIEEGYDRDNNGEICVSEMKQIYCLWIEDKEIESLEGMENAVNMTELSVSDNNITDLTPLAKLTKLENLYVKNNELTSLPDMSAMTGLNLYDTYWDEDNNEVCAAKNMFSGNKITKDGFDGKFVVEPTEEWLVLNSYDSTEVVFEDDALFNALSRYGVDSDSDGVIVASEMAQVTYLYLYREGISSLSGLEYAVNLESLEISYNNISDLTPISKLTKLYYLNARNNDLTSLPDLSALTKLNLYERHVDEMGNSTTVPQNMFGGNEIPKEGFANKFAEEPTEAWLLLNSYDGSTVDIEDDNLLQALIDAGFDTDGNGLMSASEILQVDSLYASGYEITNINGLEHAENLWSLNLNDNQIEDITSIATLERLVYLEIRNNKLTSIPVLSSLVNLLLDENWGYDEEGNEIRAPRNIFGGNQITRDGFTGKFVETPSDAWLDLNSYDGTIVNVPDTALLNYLIDNGYDTDEDGKMCVSEMKSISGIYASYYGISDITGLEYATELTYLQLGNNNITDISPLSGLEKMYYCDLDYNEITDLSPLSDCTALEYLYVRNNKLTSMADFTSLTELLLYDKRWDADEEGNEILVREARDLFSGNRITRAEFDGKFSEDLTEDWLDRNSYDGTIVNIPDTELLNCLIDEGYDTDDDGKMCISEMKSIVDLYASYCGISDITGLEYATELESLYLDGNNIKDISPLSGLDKMYSCNLDDNRITDLSPLSECTALEYLYARKNKLTSMADLTALTELQLYDEWWESDEDGNEILVREARDLFGGNMLSRDEFDGKFCEDLTEEWLDLNSFDDSVVNIPDSALRKYLLEEYDREGDGVLSETEMSLITHLYLRGAGIKDLTGLEKAVNLKCLYIPNNKIEDISVVTELTNLRELIVNNNKLTDIPDLKDLENLSIYTEHWYNDDGDEYCVLEPMNMFSGNQIVRANFIDKFNVELTEEWLELNSYDGTIIEIPNARLKSYLVSHYDTDDDDEICMSEIFQVESISISSRRIDSIEGLQYAKNLDYIWLRHTNVTDISPLAGLEKLEYCNLDYNLIEDITPLTSCPLLSQLSVTYNNVQSIPDMNELEKLRLYDYYDLWEESEYPLAMFTGNKALNSAECFEGKFNVELTEEWLKLNVYDDTVITFEDENLKNALLAYDRDGDGELCISEVITVEELDLNGLDIASLEGIENLENLWGLYVRNNKITDLTPVAQLTNLKYFDASYNEISSCEPLRNNTTLSHLWLNGNKLTDISPLSTCTELRYFELRENDIAEIPDMTELESFHLYSGIYPANIFGGNPQLTSQEMFEGKFHEDVELLLDEYWYAVNLYNETSVEFADENLKKALVANGIDKNGDGEISYTELKCAEYIDISNAGITDLSGLEHTHCLVSLNISNNNITNLDVLTECNRTIFNEDAVGPDYYWDDSPFIYLDARNNKLEELPRLEFLSIWSEEDELRDMFSGNSLTKEDLLNAFSHYDVDDSEFQEWIALNLGSGMADDGEWVEDENGWQYLDSNGEPYSNKFVWDKGDEEGLYYLGSDGYMVTNQWVSFYEDGDEFWRYMSESGAAIMSDEFELQAVDDSGNMYAFDCEGTMMTGWVISSENRMVEDEEEWKDADYYFNSKGVVVSGWKQIKVYGGWKKEYAEAKHFFYFDPETYEKQTGLITVDDLKYYLDENGAMLEDQEITIDGITYVIGEDGVLYDMVFQFIDQPENTYAEEGNSVELTVDVIMAESYQWYYGEDGEDWADVTDDIAKGGTTETLTVTLSDINEYYQYYCVVTDADGNTLESNKVGVIPVPGTLAEGTWYIEDGVWYFADEDGENICEAFALSGGALYYLDENGQMLTNSLFIDENCRAYYFGNSGQMARNRWQNFGDDENPAWSYFDMLGRRVSGKKTISGKTYAFDEEGVMLTGWVYYDEYANCFYKASESEWAHINCYYFDEYGAMVKSEMRTLSVYGGWKNSSGYADHTFYFLSNGRKARHVLRTIEGNKYYFDDTGARLENQEVTVGGVTYVLDADGVATEKPEVFEIVTQPEKVYYHDEDSISFTIEATGVKSYQWYYSGDGEIWYAVTDEIGSGWDTDTLVLATTDDNECYQYYCEVTDADGNTLTSDVVEFIYTVVPVVIGTWVREDDQWRLADDDGNYLCDVFSVSGNSIYYVGDDSYMVTAEFVEYDGKLYYFGNSGAMATNRWVSFIGEDGNTYWRYMRSNGRSVGYGSATKYLIDGNYYYFDSNGIMLTGWISTANDDFTTTTDWKNSDYYCDEYGARVSGLKDISVVGGWKNPDGEAVHTFYFSSQGKKITGRRTISDKYYYFDETGAMLNGWISYSDEGVAALEDWKAATIYCDETTGERITGWLTTTVYGGWKDTDGYAEYKFYFSANGLKREAGLYQIDYSYYYFDETGAMLSDTEITIEDVTYTIDSNGVATEKVVKELAIISSPQSVTADDGEKVSFAIEAEGEGLTYQWQYQLFGKTNWSKWSTKTSSSMSLTASGTYHKAQIRCVVTDADGKSLISESATLTVNGMDKFEITEHPSDVTTDEGTKVYFAVEATGNGLTYQWQYQLSGKTNWSKWSTKTASGMSLTANETYHGAQIRCVVTDADGNVLTSNSALLKINGMDKFEITEHPSDVNVDEGTKASFAVVATGNGLTYQWQYKLAGKTTWSKWSTKTASSMTLTVSEVYNGAEIRCVVTDADGNTLTSDAATVTISGMEIPFEITSHPADVAVDEGTKASFAVVATGTGLTYQWQYKYAGKENWSKWSTKTASSMSLTVSDVYNGAEIRCVVTDANGNTLTSNAATVTINGKEIPFEITSQPVDVTAAAGAKAKFAVEATGTGLTYQWQYKLAGRSNWSKWSTKTSNSMSLTVSATYDGAQIRCVVTDSNGNSITSNEVTLTMSTAD